MPGKKPEKKAQQEPPAEQQPEIMEQAEMEDIGIPDAPLAASAPNIADRLKAAELANIELEKRVQQLERNCRTSHGMR